jgi:hypothetical protein
MDRTMPPRVRRQVNSRLSAIRRFSLFALEDPGHGDALFAAHGSFGAHRESTGKKAEGIR